MTFSKPPADGPTIEEWQFKNLPPYRVANLTAATSFETITTEIIAGIRVSRAGVHPLENYEEDAGATARRLELTIKMARPELCDLFFNGRDGLRARYWISPGVGDAATRHFIDACLPSIEAYLQQNAHEIQHEDGAVAMTSKDMLDCLQRPTAKVWPEERDFNEKGLYAVRWQPDKHPKCPGKWEWAPPRGDLEIKGAFVNPAGQEFTTPGKEDRAEQIFLHGFS